MKIRYEFVDGEVSEVEVTEEIGSVIVESRRLEDNLARKERYHCYSLDAVDFEGSGYASKDTPESLLEQTTDKQHIKRLLKELPEVQKRRLLLYAQGKSLREIARLEGVDYGPHIEDQCFKEAGYWRDRELPPYLREGAFPALPSGG